MADLTKRQGEAFCNTLNAFNEAWASRQKENAGQPTSGKTAMLYTKLSEALNQPAIRDHLGAEAAELRTQLAEAAKTNNFSKTDAFFDDLTNDKGKVAELVKVAGIEKGNPKLTVAAKLEGFGKKVAGAFESILSKNRAA